MNLHQWLYRTVLLLFVSTVQLFYCSVSSAQALNAAFTFQDATVCENVLVCITDQTTGGTPNYTYSWNFAGQGTSTLKNPCWTFTGTGPFTVTLTVTDSKGATDQATGVVTVFNSPTASFSVDDAQGCRPQTVCFTDNSVMGDAPINSWGWTFGDGNPSTQQNPCHTYSTPGTYTVNVLVVDTNGCFDNEVLTAGITVYDNPKANFTTQPTSVVCNVPGTFNFTDASLQADTNGVPIVSWVWTFGDASPAGSGSSTSHTYNATGPYSVKLVITDQNGCKDSITKTVYVDNFDIFISTTAPADTAGCVPHIVAFMGSYYSVLGATGKPSLYSWSFPGGIPNTAVTTTGPTPAINYNNPGTYNVIVTATNGFSCAATDTFVINVFPLPDINFSADTTKSCQAPFPVTFTDNTPDAAEWIWDFENSGDWSVDDTNNPASHIYDTGCYNVSLIVTNIYGCIDTLKINDYICVKEPIAQFYIDTFCGCVPLMVGFRDTSVLPIIFPDDSIVTWHWDFGDGWFIEGGDSAMDDTTNKCLTNCTFPYPTHTYVDTGTYDSVMLIIITKLGCRDTVYSSTLNTCDLSQPFCKSGCGVGVGIRPNAAFYVEDTMGCFPFSITPKFNNISSTYSNDWAWDFENDGQIDDETFEPPYTYGNFPDTFSVMLIAKMHECRDTVLREDYIHVLSSKADFSVTSDFFTGSPYAFCYGDSQITGGWEVTINDGSYHADWWMYDFGDTNALSNETKDTCFKIWDDTVKVEADSTFYKDTLIEFWVPPNPADPYCNNYHSIYVAEDTAIIPTTATPPTTPWTLDTVFFPGDTIIYNCDTIVLPPLYRIAYSQTLCFSGDTVFYFNMGHSPLTACDSARIDSMTDCIDTFYVFTDTVYKYWLVDSSFFWNDSMFVNSVDTDTTYLNIYYPNFVDGNPNTIDRVLLDSVTLCGDQKYYRYLLIDEKAYEKDTSYMEPVLYYPFYSDYFYGGAIIDGDPLTIDTVLVDSTILHRLIMVFCNDTVSLIPDILFHPNDTIIADTFVIITPGGMVIDSAQSATYGCDLTISEPADTTLLLADTIITASWMDTACIEYASVQVIPNTIINYCYVTIALPDLSLDLLADAFVTPTNPVLVVEDSLGNQVFSSPVTYTVYPDTITVQLSPAACANYDTSYMVNGYIYAINFQRFDTVGLRFVIDTPDTITTETDTVCPYTIWHNCKYEMSPLVFPDSTVDVTPYDLNFRPYPFEHTFTDTGVYTITLYTRNSETECIDSTTREVYVCRIVPDFGMTLQPANGCQPVKVNFYDSTKSVCGVQDWLWDFGDGCSVLYLQQFATSTDPIDPMWIFGYPNCNFTTISGTYLNPVKDYPDGGNYTVTLIKADLMGCSDSVQKQIVVHENPKPGFEGDILEGCTGLEVHFCDTNYYTEPNEIVTWVWTYTNVTAIPPVTVIDTTDLPCDDFVFNIVPGSGPQNYFDVRLQVLDEFGCTYILSKPQYVNVTKATASMVFDNTWCDDKALTIASNSSVTAPATYSWDFCDGTVFYDTSSTMTHTWMVDTCDTFNISLYITDVYGCSDDTTMPIYIADPKAYFDTASVDDTKCPPLVACFSDLSKTECDSFQTWAWDFGDGNVSTSQNPCNSYIDHGTYDVRLVVTTWQGCVDTFIRDDFITVSGPKFISATYLNIIYCDPCPLRMTFSITVFNTQWLFLNYGDGAVDTVFISTTDTVTIALMHCYERAGTYNPYVYIWDPLSTPPEDIGSCGIKMLPPVSVTGPLINFTTADTICGPRIVNFTNTSTNTTEVDYWVWNYGDPGSPDNISNDINGVHNYQNEGVYDVSLTAYVIKPNGDTCIYVTLKEEYVTVFNLPYPPSEGCPPLEVTFYLDSAAMGIPLNTNTMIWNFGDSAATPMTAQGNPVTHTYNGTGDSIKYTWYTVTATFDNGCFSRWDSLIKVYPVPTANFTMDPMVQGSTISTIIFINASGGDTLHHIYFWDFGDGDEGTIYYPNRDVTHSYAATGEFLVTLIVEDAITSCRDTIQKIVNIKIKVPNIFTPNGDGVNEYFNLDIPDGMLDLRLVIFNRWGIKVYESDDYPSDCSDNSANKDRCWDGRDLHGNPVNNDTYYYILNLEDKAVFNGWVMVLREKK